MSKVEKISISLNAADLKWLRAFARRHDHSLSAVMTEATRLLRQHEARQRLLRRFGDDVKMTKAEADAIRAEWRG